MPRAKPALGPVQIKFPVHYITVERFLTKLTVGGRSGSATRMELVLPVADPDSIMSPHVVPQPIRNDS